MHENNDDVTYFDCFGAEYILKEIHREQKYRKKNLQNTNKLFNKVWILLHCFFYYMLEGKNLLDHTNLSSLSEYEENDKIILKYFQ